ncbi:hypothetical protein [Salinispora arenicola]|uniref:hypothetical protein n=1 Tax=Salinispora arenicola TaxID=168697 RepID=UPI00039BDF6D|nr:hypothetical protein [Salinispora arenicola]
MLNVASVSLFVAGRLRIIGPTLNLGDPRLVVCAQQVAKRLDVLINGHGLNPLAARRAYQVRTDCPRPAAGKIPDALRIE